MADTANSPLRKRPRPSDSPAPPAPSETREGLLDFEEDMINVVRRTPKSPRPPLLARDANASAAPSVNKNGLGIRETKRLLDEKNALIFQLRLQIDELKRRLERVPRDTQEAVQSYENLKTELEKAHTVIRDQKYSIENLKADLVDAQQLDEEAHNLELVVLDLEKALEEAQSQIRTRDEELTELHREIDSLREANLRTSAKLEASHSTSSDAKLRVQLVEALRNAARFQTDVARLKNERQELFNKLTEERQTSSADLASLRAENEELKQAAEKQKLQYSNLHQQLELERSAASALNEAHARAEHSEHARYAKLESDYKDKTAELQKVRTDLSATISKLEGQMARLNDQVLIERQKAQTAVAERETTIVELKPELARSRARVKELELQLEILKDESHAQLEQTQQQAEERAQSRASNYQAQLEKLQGELDAKRSEAAILANTIKRLEHSARERHLAYTEETKQLKEQLGDLFEKRTAAEAELKGAKLELDGLQRAAKLLQERQRRLEQEASDLQVANRQAVTDAKAIEADKLRLQLKLESIEGRPLSASERSSFEEKSIALEALKAETARQSQEWERLHSRLQEESKVLQVKNTELQRQVEVYASQDQSRLQEQSWRIEQSLKESWQREQERMNGELSNALNEISSMRRLHGDVVRQLDEAQRQIVLRQTTLTELELVQTRLRDQLHELDQTIVVKDNEIRNLREQMAHYTAKISSMQTTVTEAAQQAQKAELRAEQAELERHELMKRLNDAVSETSAKLEALQLDASRKVASASESGAASAEAQFVKRTKELREQYEGLLAAQKQKLRQISESNENQLIKEIVKIKRALDCTLKFSTELEEVQAQTCQDLVFVKEFASYSDAKANALDSPRPPRTFAGVAAFVHALVRMRRTRRRHVLPETDKKYRDMLRKHSAS